MAKSRTTPEQRRRWREANREKVREYSRKWNADKRNANKETYLAQVREYRSNPEVRAKIYQRHNKNRRKYNASSRYGITSEQFEQIKHLLDVGPCEICGRSGPVHIDHNHRTNKFRGLLCGPCNRAIGLLQDSADIILAASNYLRDKD